MSFEDFDIQPALVEALKRQNITEPTPVQAQSIPIALEGHDLLSIAQTGTGKTLAFGLPSLCHLADIQARKNNMLVLAPTRELAVQVHDVLKDLGKKLQLRTVCIYGGVSISQQTKTLRKGVAIIVATPGRLLDHMERGNINFRDLSVLVLDEADRMLDMGFMPDIKRIMSKMPEDRQTMLFSATFPKEIERLTKEFMYEPKRIEVARSSTPADTVRQTVYTVEQKGKMDLLKDLLDNGDIAHAIVFARTKHGTEKIARSLSRQGYDAEGIHGDKSQNQRQRAIDGFRRGKFNILVATDVAARGLDVQGVTHVINYDMPGTPDDYVHRIGRTARANAEGDAITFVCPDQGADLVTVEKAIKQTIDIMEWEGAVELSFAKSKKGGGYGGRRGGGGGGGYGGRRNGGGGGGGRGRGRNDRPQNRSSRNGEVRGGQRRDSQEREDKSWSNNERNGESRPQRSNNRPEGQYRGKSEESRGRDERSGGRSERNGNGRPQSRSGSEGRSRGRDGESSSRDDNSWNRTPRKNGGRDGASPSRSSRNERHQSKNGQGGRPSPKRDGETGNRSERNGQGGSQSNRTGGQRKRSNGAKGHRGQGGNKGASRRSRAGAASS